MNRLFILPLALLLLTPAGFSAESSKSIDRKPVTTTKQAVTTTKQAVPQSLLDALERCEADRVAVIAADISLGIATQAVAKATKQRVEATAALRADTAAFIQLWAAIYGTIPDPPPPDPPEPPKPPVPPAPVIQRVQIVVIEETGDSTPAFSKIRNSAEIRQWATSGGHAVFFIDVDSAVKAGGTWKTWADRSRNVKLPYLGIAPHEGGDPIKEGECPQDVAAFLKLVQQFGGVGKAPSDCPSGVCPVKQGVE